MYSHKPRRKLEKLENWSRSHSPRHYVPDPITGQKYPPRLTVKQIKVFKKRTKVHKRDASHGESLWEVVIDKKLPREERIKAAQACLIDFRNAANRRAQQVFSLKDHQTPDKGHLKAIKVQNGYIEEIESAIEYLENLK